MAQAETIRDFMVALGFKTDNSGLAQMQGAMKGVELKAVALKAALLSLATGAVIAVRQTASELDKLYFSSQRIGASATNITAFGNAISQMGGNAESAIGTLDSLAEKMRNSPGYEGMINSLGVNTKQANGEMRDRVEVMKDLSGVLAQMPAYQANAYANSLGIDQNTLLAMRDGKFVSNMEKYQKIQEQLGMNDDLTKSGNEFMTEYRDLTMVTKTGFQVIVMQAGKALIPILRLLNQLIQAGISAFSQLNPEIKQMLGVGLRFAMLGLVFGGFIKMFGMLFKFIPMIKSFIGVLKLFRLAFLASPIGIILALAAALALLYDDYKTWRDGGKSLFDWSKWTNGIDTIINKIKDFLDLLNKIKDKVINFVQKIISDPVGAIQEVVETTKDALSDVADDIVNSNNTIATGVDTAFGLADKGLAFFGNKDAQARVEQRERGEIGYQPKPKIETPKNAKDLASFAENADRPNQTSFTNKIENITQKGVGAVVNVGKLVDGAVKEGLIVQKTSFSNNTLRLSKQDIEDLIKVTSTEVVASLKGEAFTKQTHGVVDTILNRVASGKWGSTVRDVANAKRQFTKITGPKSYKTKSGKIIKLNPYGSVQNMPLKDINPKVKAEVMNYLEERANGQKSSVGGHLNYANPYVSDMKNRKAWVDAFYKKAVENNLVFGSGKNVHGHGTTNDLKKFIPKPFNISLNQPETKTNYINDRKNLFSGITFQNIGAPVKNPEKSHINSINSKMSASSVTIHQEFKTDMTINGAKEPVESANAVKRQQENSMTVMARNAKSFLV